MSQRTSEARDHRRLIASARLLSSVGLSFPLFLSTRRANFILSRYADRISAHSLIRVRGQFLADILRSHSPRPNFLRTDDDSPRFREIEWGISDIMKKHTGTFTGVFLAYLTYLCLKTVISVLFVIVYALLIASC